MMSFKDRKTLLLVEDEVILAMSEKLTLEKYGYKVIIANSGEKAIRTISTTPDIQLILMDIDLGKGMDGSEAAEEILKGHDVPVVFLSSHTEAEVVEKTEKITSYGYVVKNSSVTVLDASIKMAFKLSDAKKHAAGIEQNLLTHQIELQMQNEELRRKQAELESLRLRYFDLYDMAPVADFTLGETGQILEVNLTAADLLGIPRKELVEQSFDAFIHPVDQDIFYRHRKTILETGAAQHCELRMRKRNGTVFNAYLKAAGGQDEDGNPVYREAVVDLEQNEPAGNRKEDPA